MSAFLAPAGQLKKRAGWKSASSALFREKRHRGIADRGRINVGLQFLHFARPCVLSGNRQKSFVGAAVAVSWAANPRSDP
jgi:hypothetical protein